MHTKTDDTLPIANINHKFSKNQFNIIYKTVKKNHIYLNTFQSY